MIADFNVDAGAAAAAAIMADGFEAASIGGDVSRSDDVKAMVDATVSTFGGLTILYNNAGIMMGEDDDPVVTGEDVWERTMDVNLKGVFLCNKHGIPAMLASGGGSIINVASFVAHNGAATPQIAYTTTKGGVLA